jgi:hypothetical protein
MNVPLTEESTIFDEELTQDKKFWMDLILPSRSEMDFMEKIKQSLKRIDLLSAIVACLIILISQFEYELRYYPCFYVNNKPLEYNGLGFRILYTILSALLGNKLIYKLIL